MTIIELLDWVEENIDKANDDYNATSDNFYRGMAVGLAFVSAAIRVEFLGMDL